MTELWLHETKANVQQQQFLDENLFFNSVRLTMTVADVALVRKTYSHLGNINFTASSSVSQDFVSISYRANKLAGLSFNRGFSHRFSVVSTNDVGRLEKSTLITVVEKPRWKKALSDFKCSENCFSNEEHVFECSAFEDDYKDFSLQLQYDWYINGVNIINFYKKEIRSPYFVNSGKMLTVKKILTKNHNLDVRFLESIRNATLECGLTIRSNDPSIATQYTIYNSINDPDIKAINSIKLRIIEKISINDSSTKILLMVCLPIILISCITIVIVMSFCLRRSRGESYDIDGKERKVGIDPVQELNDTMVFKTYNRMDSNVVMEPDLVSIGRYSNRTNIGELDNDTLDINDEGSIVDVYTVNSK